MRQTTDMNMLSTSSFIKEPDSPHNPMENHKKTLGILFIVSAVFQIIAMLVVGLFVTFVAGIISSEEPDAHIPAMIISLLSWLPAVVVLFVSVPSLIAGIALVSRQPWAPLMAMIVGCLKLFSFPFGTALGIYAIWVYFEDKKVSESFAVNRPPNS